MNIVFFGSSEFAVPSLKALLASQHKVVCVVTQPDREKGRHLYLSGTAVKSVAEGALLNIYQPENVNSSESIKFLKGIQADLFAVISYGQILSEKLLSIPEIFCINAHASLLPKYRGAAPINRAIMNGEKETGVTIIKLTSRMDAGPIILQQAVEISDEDTDVSLEERLSGCAGKLLLEVLSGIENNNYKLTPQKEEGVSFAPKLKRHDALINWGKPAQDIYNLIRGITRWPGAFTYYKGKLLKIYKAKIFSSSALPASRHHGEIIKVSKEGIVTAAGKDDLLIEELQIEGKRRMQAEEFILGHKISAGEKFSGKK